MGKLLLAIVCLLLLQVANHAEEPAADPIAKKITAAKDAYYAERDKADEALIKLLERKEATAKQAGDLKTLEAVRAELEAFRQEGVLPKLVSLTIYESSMKTARTKLETVYQAAIKTYTQADKLDVAKEIQKELDEFRGQKAVQAKPAADPLQPNTVWIGGGNTLTILERKGDSFRAQLVNMGYEREIESTVKDNKFSWQPADVKTIRGGPGKAHAGTIIQDDGSYKILITYGDPAKPAGSYTLVPASK